MYNSFPEKNRDSPRGRWGDDYFFRGSCCPEKERAATHKTGASSSPPKPHRRKPAYSAASVTRESRPNCLPSNRGSSMLRESIAVTHTAASPRALICCPWKKLMAAQGSRMAPVPNKGTASTKVISPAHRRGRGIPSSIKPTPTERKHTPASCSCAFNQPPRAVRICRAMGRALCTQRLQPRCSRNLGRRKAII